MGFKRIWDHKKGSVGRSVRNTATISIPSDNANRFSQCISAGISYWLDFNLFLIRPSCARKGVSSLTSGFRKSNKRGAWRQNEDLKMNRLEDRTTPAGSQSLCMYCLSLHLDGFKNTLCKAQTHPPGKSTESRNLMARSQGQRGSADGVLPWGSQAQPMRALLWHHHCQCWYVQEKAMFRLKATVSRLS